MKRKLARPKTAKTHHDNREAICIICTRRADRKVISKDIEKQIREQSSILNGLELTDTRVPTGSCASCRKALREKKELKIPPDFRYDTNVVIPANTRSNSDSHCTMHMLIVQNWL